MLKQKIKDSRDIKDNSLDTYLSSLRKIKKKIDNNDGDLDNTKFLKDYNKVMIVINQESTLTSKKNKLTAVLVALGSDTPKNETLIDKYINILKKYNEMFLSSMKEQTMSEKQKKNWLEYSDLINVVKNLEKEVKHQNLSSKETLNKNQLDVLQQLLIVRTYISYPLRNDFADMKILNLTDYKKLDKKTQDDHNYLVLLSNNKKEFRINQYKNNKKFGKKVYPINSILNRVINLWLKFNKTGWYLIKSNGTPMNPNSITKYLNKIFQKEVGKTISTSMIRHILISHSLKDDKTIKQKEKEANDLENKFLNSSNTQNIIYRKIK